MTTNERALKYLQKKYPLEKNTKDKPITLIVLDGQNINHITDDVKAYLENFKDLEELTLSICNLTSLKNFPDLPNLKKIELNDNHFKGNDLENLCKYTTLSELRIANNDIKTLEEIKCLENLKELIYLDFTDSPITKMKNYREKIFENFKNLKYLDGVDKNGKVLEEDDDEDEEDELEEDKEFIDDDKKEGDEELAEDDEEEGEDDEKDNQLKEADDDDDEERANEEQEDNEDNEDDDDIKNPSARKKKKLE